MDGMVLKAKKVNNSGNNPHNNKPEHVSGLKKIHHSAPQLPTETLQKKPNITPSRARS